MLAQTCDGKRRQVLDTQTALKMLDRVRPLPFTEPIFYPQIMSAYGAARGDTGPPSVPGTTVVRKD